MAYVIGRVHVAAVAASLENRLLNAHSGERLDSLMRAALIGSTRAVGVFLDRGIDSNSADKNGHTPLMEAVFGGHICTVLELLDRGSDVNAQDSDGWTALMEAVAKGRADIVRMLINHGADIRIGNKKAWMVLKAAAKCNTEVARLLKKALSGKLPFVEACPQDDLKPTN